MAGFINPKTEQIEIKSKTMRIYFSPTYPQLHDYSIISMIHHLGYSVARTSDEHFDIAYMWDDSTHVEPSPELLQIAENKLVLNINCRDISKVKVDEVCQEVCGYGSLVDPNLFEGKCIKKYDENGKGGGEILDCPLPDKVVDDGSVYQRYIETNLDGPQLEYRVPITMGTIPLVFEVYKDNLESTENRLVKHQNIQNIVPREVAEVFSAEEQRQILLFCANIGFDMGELDVLRCVDTGRMYIIDANTTPTYFSMLNRYWQPAGKTKAVATVAKAWEKQLSSVLALTELDSK